MASGKRSVNYKTVKKTTEMIPADSEWPNGWDQWPESVNKFTVEAWLSQPKNRNLDRFDNIPFDGKGWVVLEEAITKVLNIKSSKFKEEYRAVCADVWGPRWYNKHPEKEDLHAIGRGTATRLLNTTEVEWKDASKQWVTEISLAMAPRFLKLWKKNQRQDPKYPEKKAQQLKEGKKDKAIQPKVETPKRPKQQRLADTKRRLISPSFGNNDQELHHRLQASMLRQMIFHTIIVRMELARAETLGLPLHVPVGIAAIVRKDVQLSAHEDIRCEHLSWDKFKTALGALCPDYCHQSLGLFYSVSYGEGSGVTEVEIMDEEDFKRAVGTLEVIARTTGGGNKLFMSLRVKDGF